MLVKNLTRKKRILILSEDGVELENVETDCSIVKKKKSKESLEN